ncbi:antitoxin [Microbacterium protaetiae]|uniref:Antitoxin n=2 Tax=Microbacterium protaetiae TaxID=2509458 RepID=A0A4P6EH18_9MICO|nr:antitoxin [Microbacterium protaetiae]
MARTKVFYSNRSQAVRLPKDVALPDGVSEVEVTVVGDSRVITPVYHDLVEWWDIGVHPDEDFLTDRDDSAPQEREWL